MSISKTTTTKLVLYTNIALLVIGTFVQSADHPLQNIIMSGLFVTWIATLIWHVQSGISAKLSE